MKTFSGFAYYKSRIEYKKIMYCSEQQNNYFKSDLNFKRIIISI